MSKRGENIRKRSDGRWEARVLQKNNGISKYHSIYGHSYKEVREKKEIYLKTNSVSLKESHDTNNITMSQVLDSWILSKELFLKKSTILKYKNIIATHILPELGNLNINNINNDIINKFLLDKQISGRMDGKGGLSNSYIKTMAIILSSCIDYAVNNRLCSPLPGKVLKPIIKKNEVMVLNKAMQKELEDKLSYSDSMTEVGILLALNSGLRIGEICALRWENIDFVNRILYVRQSIVRVPDELNSDKHKTMLVVDNPKSQHSVRDIPINSKLYSILEKYKYNRLTDYILSGTSQFISPRTFEYRFHRVLNKHRIQDFNFHMLRHTFATRCIECGVDVKSLSEIMGHSNVNITLNSYVHSSFENKRIQLEKLNNI